MFPSKSVDEVMSWTIRPILSVIRNGLAANIVSKSGNITRICAQSTWASPSNGGKVISVPPPVWSTVKEMKLPTTLTSANLLKIPILDKAKDLTVLAPDVNRKVSPLILPALNIQGSMEAVVLKRLPVYRPYKPKNMLMIRREKMNKHRLRKFRKKYMALLKKIRTKREIKKEKLFRAELLAQIREAEKFDAEAYVKNVLSTIDRSPVRETLFERKARYDDLRRIHRSNTDNIRPKFDDPVP